MSASVNRGRQSPRRENVPLSGVVLVGDLDELSVSDSGTGEGGGLEECGLSVSESSRKGRLTGGKQWKDERASGLGQTFF